MNASELPRSPTLRIFPLHGIARDDQGVPICTCGGPKCKDVGKHPLVGWRTYDENTKGPGGGYGIQTGRFNDIFVVDLDVKPPKNGIDALMQLAAGRAIPDTLSVLTPSGGVHLYFRLPPDLYVPKTLSVLGPGIDIIGEGGFVVGPGSPHKVGGFYQEVPGPLADAPDWLLALVVKEREPPRLLVTQNYTVDPESPEGARAIAWARAFLARAEPAVEGRDGSGRMFAACAHLMYSALPLDVLRQLVEEVYNPRCEPPWSRTEIDHKLTDADRRFAEPRGLCSPDFERMHSWTITSGSDTEARTPSPLHEYSFEAGMRSNTETRRATINEIAGDLFDHVSWAGVLMFDVFKDRVVAVDPPMKMDAETSSGLSDNDVQLVRQWFEYHGKKLSTQDVAAAIETVARRRAFHPVQDMLQSLAWDGVARLDNVLPNYFQSPTGSYERAIGPRWFISLVARVMTPGCQSDCTLILEGKQGIGKTSAFRALMRDPSWYAESSCGVDSKDFYENLRGVWLMGFDELDSLTRGALTKVKTVLTATRDRYRKSYGRYADDYPRSCGFCGSTNAEQYFNDPTGARRLWPVRVLRPIDIERITADRDQLWAEAFARWQAGDVWHVDTSNLRALCEDEQEARLEIDVWEEIIRRWFGDATKFTTKPTPEEPSSVFKGVRPFDGSRGVTTADVLEHAVGKLRGQWAHGDAIRVGRILHRINMKRIRVSVTENVREWRYVFSTT